MAKSKPFDEIFWNLVCRCFPTTKSATKKLYFWISAFFGRFLTKKQPKLTKNEKKWQNPNLHTKFSEICYVDASQQNNMLQKNFFWISAFLAVFNQKTAKIDQKWRKLAKSKRFDEIFWNLVCRCFPAKQNAAKNFWDFGFFCRF